MATLYPFRIEVTYKNGDTLGFFTESLARDTEPVISASIMNAKINCMPRATIIGLSGSAISGGYLSAEPDNDNMVLGSAFAESFGDTRSGKNPGLSCSFDDPSTGSLFFHDTESTSFGGLDHYTFFGTKVCSVLGLPEGIPIYTENFKLSDDSTDPTNYLSGDVIADGVAVKQSFKLAPQARLKSNLVWDKENGEGLLQWVSGSSTELLFGYDKNADKYVLTAADTPTFAISGVDTIGVTTATIGTTITDTILNESSDVDILSGRTSFSETVYDKGQLKIDVAGDNVMTGQLLIQDSESETFAAGMDKNDFQLYLRNNHSNTVNNFAGIAFDVGTEDDPDSIMGAIAVLRDNTTAELHDGNMIFCTNDDADDDLTERMRITHDGLVGIGESNPDSTLEVNGDVHVTNDLTVDGHFTGGGTRGYFFFGESSNYTSTRYLDMAQDHQANSTDGILMGRAGSITGITVNYNIASRTAAQFSGQYSSGTFNVLVDGTAVFTTSANYSATGAKNARSTQAIGVDTFSAGAVIQANSTITNASAGGAASAVTVGDVTLYVEITFDS